MWVVGGAEPGPAGCSRISAGCQVPGHPMQQDPSHVLGVHGAGARTSVSNLSWPSAFALVSLNSCTFNFILLKSYTDRLE